MVRRPSEALGMTIVWFALSTPVIFAVWLGLSRPQYEWLTVALPAVVALGAPFAYIIGGAFGPRLGRLIAAPLNYSRRTTQEAARSPEPELQESPPERREPTVHRIEVSDSLPVTDEVQVRPSVLAYRPVPEVRDALEAAGCNVFVAFNSSEALDQIAAHRVRYAVLDASVLLSDIDVFRAAEQKLGRHGFSVVIAKDARSELVNVAWRVATEAIVDVSRFKTPGALETHFRHLIESGARSGEHG